jgi:hypothetical protein
VNLDAYAKQFQQEVIAAAEASPDGALRADVFTEVAIERLTAAGEINDGTVASYRARGLAVSGWSLDDDGTVLHLLLADYRNEVPPPSLTATAVHQAFRRLTEFLQRSRNGHADQLEESSPVFEIADLIHREFKALEAIRLYLLSDAHMTREVRVDNGHVESVQVTHHIWDVERFRRLDTSGVEREEITVDLVERTGQPLPCLQGPQLEDHTVYLLLVPGNLLQSIYSDFGARLLERNVRSFLQARGAVNRGIRDSLATEPERFLAYNNGISATASSVELVELQEGGMGISTIRDLQIVNGGQTTASIHNAAVRDRTDVSGVHVQAKLTVVSSSVIDELVPNISRFSNTQNKVTGADFSANDPFHVRVEELSRSIWAPAPDGGQRQTRWFYERARGQYADEVLRAGTPAKQRQFKISNPSSQKFTKTDLAKFEHSWEQLPHLVSLGAEKNFREYMLRLSQRGPLQLDTAWFERLVAKAILFRSTEKIVSAQQFGGYRANIVAYTIAKLTYVTQHRVDLSEIWKQQLLSDALRDAIAELSHPVHTVIINPSGRVRHVGEWAKKLDCWRAVEEIPWSVPSALQRELISVQQPRQVTAQRAANADTSPEQEAVVLRACAIDAETWFGVAHWAKQTSNLQPWQRGLAFSLGRLIANDRTPSLKQATQGLRLLEEAQRLGFRAPSGG